MLNAQSLSIPYTSIQFLAHQTNFTPGLLEDPPQDGCFRGADCPFAHVSLATVPGAHRALAILIAEVRLARRVRPRIDVCALMDRGKLMD